MTVNGQVGTPIGLNVLGNMANTASNKWRLMLSFNLGQALQFAGASLLKRGGKKVDF